MRTEEYTIKYHLDSDDYILLYLALQVVDRWTVVGPGGPEDIAWTASGPVGPDPNPGSCPVTAYLGFLVKTLGSFGPPDLPTNRHAPHTLVPVRG